MLNVLMDFYSKLLPAMEHGSRQQEQKINALVNKYIPEYQIAAPAGPKNSMYDFINPFRFEKGLTTRDLGGFALNAMIPGPQEAVLPMFGMMKPTGQLRAKIGGEIGPNGEGYPGGAFIATTEMPKKQRLKIEKAASGKVAYEPYKWKVPEPGEMEINRLSGTALNPRTGEINYNFLKYSGRDENYIKTIEELRDKWMNGERWVKVHEYPEIANFNDLARLVKAGQPIPGATLNKFSQDIIERLEKYKP